MYHLLLLLVALTVPHRVDSKETQIHIGGLFPISGSPVGRTGRAFVPACDMALEMVNNRTDILPGYRLAMFWNDTKVSAVLYYTF